VSGTLTVSLDSKVLELAEKEAEARHTTLPEVITQQLRVMARNWEDSRTGKTPITDSLRRTVNLPTGFDEKAFLSEELQKKHGAKG
jgi:hypothetical protein